MKKRAVRSLTCGLHPRTLSTLAPELFLSYGPSTWCGQSYVVRMLCLDTDLVLQTWPRLCLITTGFCNDHWAAGWTWLPSPNLVCSSCSGTVGLCPLAARSLSLPDLLSPLAPSSPSLEKQFTFTAPWHSRTLCKGLSENKPPNFINLPSYIEGWMHNTANHTTSLPQDVEPPSEFITWISKVTSSRSLCLSSLSVSSFCCKLRAFISNIACFFSRSLS